MHEFIFDNECIEWEMNAEMNLATLVYTREYLLRLYSARGYMYLNQICEAFGCKWDPTRYNDCYYNGMRLIIEFEPIENSTFFTIHVY